MGMTGNTQSRMTGSDTDFIGHILIDVATHHSD
jgi:hypothetical protein